MTESIKTIVKTFYKVGDEEFSDYQDAVACLEQINEKASTKFVWMSEYIQHLRRWSAPCRVRFISISDATPAYEFIDESGTVTLSHHMCFYTNSDTESDKNLLMALIKLGKYILQSEDSFFSGGRTNEILGDVLKYTNSIKKAIKELEELLYPSLDECNE